MYCADDREEERMLCPFFEKDPVCRWVGGSALAVLGAEILVMKLHSPSNFQITMESCSCPVHRAAPTAP